MNIPLRTIALGLASVGTLTVHASSAPTQICNPEPHFSSSVGLRYAAPANDPRIENIIATARDPQRNPPLYERLGAPIGATVVESNGSVLLLDYRLIQDPAEMAARLRADAEIAAPFGFIGATSVACPGNPGPAPIQPIREYYNSSLNHYYLSSSNDEMNWLDNGGGGGGWGRTGQSWTTHLDSAANCYVPRYSPVYLFMGTPGVGPNSHYYTTNPAECGYLRNTVGWSYVTIPFGALRPENGACPPEAPVGLNMLYNNRAAQNDSNHRYTSDPQIYAGMIAQGWVGYGLALCVKAVGAP